MTGAPVLVPDALAHEYQNLIDLIGATARRQPVPCLTRDPAASAMWTGTPAQQVEASRECLRCPVIDACRGYGRAHPGEFGVYGSLTERERTKAARDTKREAGR